jgi:two-component system CheB/CheR fusion protein
MKQESPPHRELGVKVARRRHVVRPVMPPGAPAARAPMRVVGIGASSGGLEACTKLLDALPTPTDMAFVLVQHLDPTHPSMLVELLAEHTAMTVLQAENGMTILPEHLYVIPPGAYLSSSGGVLRLSKPNVPRGARLPFDFLLESLATEYRERAICVVLSGNGADGTIGLRAVRDAGGLVLAQDPAESGYDGMPSSAIATGLVDQVGGVAAIADALAHRRLGSPLVSAPLSDGASAAPDPVLAIIELLRSGGRHDFTLYKRGTLERRIERRMELTYGNAGPDCGGNVAKARERAEGPTDKMRGYLARLRTDPTELDLLAKDLLIHVTSFFRDPAAYEALAKQVIPSLLQGRLADQPLRIWVAGCSTGEEVYSLVILFREAAASSGQDGQSANFKLQVFASDIDAAAVATAREGLYPPGIASDVSAARLARFFTKEDGNGYRVLPDLRASVVFAVQDLLTDPPFSRLDLISCRNLMIYLGPEAQTKSVSLFHFALKTGGVLLLGSAETVGETDDRFELIDKGARLYRHVGRRRPGDLSFAATTADIPQVGRVSRLAGPAGILSRQMVQAQLCRQAVLDQHAPAAVLCNARHECLYSLGPIDRYLRVAPGHVTWDVLAMARGALRTRLRTALTRAAQGGSRVALPGGRVSLDGRAIPFTIDVQPLSSDGEMLFLICFVDTPASARASPGAASSRDASRIAELERDLEAARAELEEGARGLEASDEEQRAINEEALSVNEEYQSTNEELLTSKEELQSLNEELTVLNNQLQETLERQRTTANDLQNVLYSTDVATLFLDRALNIRFFTPATKALFNVIPTDVGRPLVDLQSLATDTDLPADAEAVLESLQPVEREVETAGGTWFRRRILPYRTETHGVEGVVITFNDITRRKKAAAALEEAKADAEAANLAKSRFLAAASHDLRQPLQTLALLQGLLAKAVIGDKAISLVKRQDETLESLSGMLDTLLDLNKIEAGVVKAELKDCQIGSLLNRLCDEFAYHAQAKGLSLSVVPCSVVIRTDPKLLEQILRNLVSNALKYTDRGRVLLGCRRRGSTLQIEVWDTGIGIPERELQAVFDEYHQIGNEARERERGLGLGLSIVQRLCALLGHRVAVRSKPGKGSVFVIEVPCVPNALSLAQHQLSPPAVELARLVAPSDGSRTGRILVVEDAPDLRNLLHQVLQDEGHQVDVAPTGQEAVDKVVSGSFRPDLVVADYNLPGGMTGLQVAGRLRESLPDVPVIILTGDISTATLQDVTWHGFMLLLKPVKPLELIRTIEGMLLHSSSGELATTQPCSWSGAQADAPVVFVVDDDRRVRTVLRTVLEDDGCVVEDYSGSAAFLAAFGAGRAGRNACLLVDAAMPGINGLELLEQLTATGRTLPAIVVTGGGDVAMAVRAMKAGALDFIEKPVRTPELLAAVHHALDHSRNTGDQATRHIEAAATIAGLTPRQIDIMDMVLLGYPSKNIAADLGISQRTVEKHRASIMRKTGTRSLPALARLALAADLPGKTS